MLHKKCCILIALLSPAVLGTNKHLSILTVIGKFPGYELDRFLENSSKIKHWVEKWYTKNSGAWHRPIFYKNWNGAILKFGKNTGRVFQKSVCVTHQKTKISLISGWVFQDLQIRVKYPCWYWNLVSPVGYIHFSVS